MERKKGGIKSFLYLTMGKPVMTWMANFAIKKITAKAREYITNIKDVITETGLYEANILYTDSVELKEFDALIKGNEDKAVLITDLPGQIKLDVISILSLVFTEDALATLTKFDFIAVNKLRVAVAINEQADVYYLVLNGENTELRFFTKNDFLVYTPMVLGLSGAYEILEETNNPFLTADGIAQDLISMLGERELQMGLLTNDGAGEIDLQQIRKANVKGLSKGDLSQENKEYFFDMLLSVHTSERFDNTLMLRWVLENKDFDSRLRFYFWKNNLGTFNYAFLSSDLFITYRRNEDSGVRLEFFELT